MFRNNELKAHRADVTFNAVFECGILHRSNELKAHRVDVTSLVYAQSIFGRVATNLKHIE